MRKDDFDRFWSACVPREARASNENIFDDVIKAIDNAEKYKHLTGSKLLEQYRERGQKIHELSQLKKLLKKRIEECRCHCHTIMDEVIACADCNYNNKQHHFTQEELQKILEGKE